MNKWKFLNKKIRYRCPYFKIVEENFLYPNSKKGTYYILDRNDTVIFIPFDGKKVWLVRQYRYLLKRYLYEFPAGLVEPEETPLKAAKRELNEEIGAKAKKWKKLGVVSLGHGFSRQKAHIYLAQDLKFLKKKRRGDEFQITAHSFKINQVEKKLWESRINDSLQFATWHLFLKFQQKINQNFNKNFNF